MELPVKFRINDKSVYYDVLDGERENIFLQTYHYNGEGYTVSFALQPALLVLAAKQSEQSKNKTRRVFNNAVECAIDNCEASGLFSIYFDKGVIF